MIGSVLSSTQCNEVMLVPFTPNVLLGLENEELSASFLIREPVPKLGYFRLLWGPKTQKLDLLEQCVVW